MANWFIAFSPFSGRAAPVDRDAAHRQQLGGGMVIPAKNPRLDLLPWHARGQHGERMTQVDHVVNSRAKNVISGGVGKRHCGNPRKQPLLQIKLGGIDIGRRPRKAVFVRLSGSGQ